jgi:hypothetical protein
MLLLVFLAGWLVPAQQASLICANVAATQTQPVRGPAAISAVLQVSSEDDHSKDTHLCMADFSLVIMRPSKEPLVVSLLSSDGEWNRSLSILLSGFSHDGKRIFGVLSEGGAYPTEQLFDYNTINGSVSLLDMRKQMAHHAPTKCPTAAGIIGTTKGGAVVVQLTSEGHCQPGGRWLFNSAKGRLQRLARGTSVIDLYSDSP